MSAKAQTSNRPKTKVSKLESDKLKTLAIEAGKYLALSSSDPLPIEELKTQAEANGYSEGEVRAMLRAEGLHSVESVLVPKQGNLLGKLWAKPASNPEPPEERSENDGEVSDGTLQQFRDWLQEREESEQSHAYTRKNANRWFAKGKDLDRSYSKDFDEFSTILITYCRGLPDESETVAEHARSFLPRKINRKRRACLKKAEAFDRYSGVSILAPKSPDRVPYADAPFTHQHDFIWTQGHISKDAFSSLNQYTEWDIHVSVEHHISDEVATPTHVLERGGNMDAQRGATTALTQELGANLPLLTCRFDARGTPEYVEKWAAELRAGTDDSFETGGVSRFQQLGGFADRADRWKARRALSEGVGRALRLSSELEYHMPSPHQSELADIPQNSSESSFDLSENPPSRCSPIEAESGCSFPEDKVPYPPAPSEDSGSSFDLKHFPRLGRNGSTV